MSAISTPSPSQIAIGFAGAAVAYLGFKAYGLYTYRRDAPASGPVPAGKTRICIAGAYSGPHDARAHKLAAAIAAAYPEKYETWFYWTGASTGSDSYFRRLGISTTAAE